MCPEIRSAVVCDWHFAKVKVHKDSLKLQKTILLCFRRLSESWFLLGFLHRRIKFANICLDLMLNHLS